MGERIVIRQNKDFETRFWAKDPGEPEGSPLGEVAHIQALTPYGMLLAGLGSCTGVVVNTYARYHGVGLEEVTLRLEYERSFREDCEECERDEKFTESISQELSFSGDLTDEEREKLYRISLQCPIHKMLKSGVKVQSKHVKPGAIKVGRK
ncbi:MAG: hypothetical protein Kow0025_08690 [Thermodesulfovibrionales bacterium]